MKRILPLLLGASLCAAQAQEAAPEARPALGPSTLTLHYDRPAQFFEESLPVGNGTLGALVYGGVAEERLSLNDITLWTGEPDTAVYAPDAHTYISQIREQLDREDYDAAARLNKHIQGHYSENYQPAGTLTLTAVSSEAPTAEPLTGRGYQRLLNLDSALVRVRYEGQTRDVFASAPDSVLVVRWTATGDSRISRRIALHSVLPHQTTAYVLPADSSLTPDSAPLKAVRHTSPRSQQALLVADGYAAYHSWPSYVRRGAATFQYDPTRGIHYRLAVRVETVGGSVSSPLSDMIQVDGADVLTLYVTSVTSFAGADRDPVRQGREYQQAALQRVEAAARLGYDSLRQRHLADYMPLFGRVQLDLGTTADSIAQLPTDVQLRRYYDGRENNPDLEEVYTQYGRYLLLASSRTPAVPANLQGLWNESQQPPWSSSYTTNINVEENYWPALTGNLAEMHLPLLEFVQQLPRTGEASARAYYGVGRGWNAGHNSDIWAMTCPVGLGGGDPKWACWTMGGAWLSTHLWEHYAFTLDRDYLSAVYPTLRGAAEFCLGWLVEKDGHLITSPGTSPENAYRRPDGHTGAVLYGATADLAMVRECLLDARAAAAALGTDEAWQDTLTQTLGRLLPYRVGRRGNLQEWYHDWDDQDPQHRHQSHLFGLYPGHHITPQATPDVAKACLTTLDIKGENTTGWSTGWRINLLARLGEGERAYRMYRRLLAYVSPDDYRGPERVHRGGTYPNLMDAHPPFQIDGNFGGCAGVIEMLVQSALVQTKRGEASGRVDLLPALPEAWRGAGRLKGVRVRGGFEVDMEWRDGRVTTLSVRSVRADRGEVTLSDGQRTWRAVLKPGQTQKLL